MLLFRRVGQRCAEGFIDFVPRRWRTWQAHRPSDLAARSSFFDVRLSKDLGDSLDRQVIERVDSALLVVSFRVPSRRCREDFRDRAGDVD